MNAGNPPAQQGYAVKCAQSPAASRYADPHAVGSELYAHFRRIAQATPDSVAVVNGRSRVTFQELLARADGLHDALRARGVRVHDYVALIFGNETGFAIAALAVWKLEAVLVPLNPLLGDREVLQLLRDTSPRDVIASVKKDDLVTSLIAAGAPIERAWLNLPEGDRWVCREVPVGRSDGNPVRSDGAMQGAALTQYSTGSTGKPKRVTRTQRNLLGELASIFSALALTPTDRVLGAVPFYHSHGLKNAVMLSLFSGATLYVAETFFPRDIAALIERERISVYPGVPFMFQKLAGLRERFDLSSLRWPLSGTAPLDHVIAEAFDGRYSLKIRRVYGTTETGLITIERQSAGFDPLNRVGTPIGGVSVEVVDELGAALPAGVDGRVKVISAFAACGYDNAEGTGGSYFDQGCYFPGDVGHISSDGSLVLSGRHRGFINVGGNKVDPAEVETVLLELPGISEAAVVGVPDKAAGEVVKAVLVSPSRVSHEEVRAHLMRRIAPFKRPRIIEFRKELPRSPLGKIVRASLLGKMPDEV